MKDNAWILLFCIVTSSLSCYSQVMKPNITPVTLISEKDKARIMNTLFKVKLLALVSQLADLLRWNLFSGNYRSNYSSEFLFVAGSEILYSEASLLNATDRVF